MLKTPCHYPYFVITWKLRTNSRSPRLDNS